MVSHFAVKLELNKGANKMAGDEKKSKYLTPEHKAPTAEEVAFPMDRLFKTNPKEARDIAKDYVKDKYKGSLDEYYKENYGGAKTSAPKKKKTVKKASGGAVHRMPDGTMMAGAKHGMKKGGRVKKCRMDGIALRGKTRAKQRSK